MVLSTDTVLGAQGLGEREGILRRHFQKALAIFLLVLLLNKCEYNLRGTRPISIIMRGVRQHAQ